MHVCRIKTTLRVDIAFYFTKERERCASLSQANKQQIYVNEKKEASPKRGHGNKILRHIALL